MNNKRVGMAVLDLIWMGISYAALLALVIIMGFIAFRVLVISFKIAIDVVGAARGIENIEGIIKQPNYGITAEKDETEIISSYIKSEIEKNSYAKYSYDLLRIETIIASINSFYGFMEPKFENINGEYAYELFRVEKAISYVNSLKKFMVNKGKKNFVKYAYIQLFKK